jgi:DnaK suppressor protein
MKARSPHKDAPSTKSPRAVPAESSANKRKTPPKKAKYPEAGDVLTHRENLEAFPDVSDQASAEVDQNFSMRIRDRERKLLKKIDEALERMNVATYGICERCSGDIPYKRLKARPVTTLCIECKTLQEQEEQARG